LVDSTTSATRVSKAARGDIGSLWASVFFAPERTPPTTLLVTAADRGEGVTQIVAALGLVGAESNAELKLLLVDFNLRHPSLADVLETSATVGVAEVLLGEASLAEAICPTALPNLSLLPAGRRLEHPLGLLRSQGLREALRGLAEEYNHVIIDVAAANRYPDAQILAGLVDGALLVTRAGTTRRESVAEAKKRIEQSRGRLLGVVLNERRFVIPGFIYRRL
jgi:capsular exopolysaccharide synthesis family protein